MAPFYFVRSPGKILETDAIPIQSESRTSIKRIVGREQTVCAVRILGQGKKDGSQDLVALKTMALKPRLIVGVDKPAGAL